MNFKLFYNYRVIIFICVAMAVTAFCFAPPGEIVTGFFNILMDQSILISDYTVIGGIGGAFLNASILCTIFIVILVKMDIKPNGSTVAALFIILGFGFCGKNLLNVWPVFLGSMLYAMFKRQPLRNYILVAMFATGLSPVVNQIFLVGSATPPIGLLKAVIVGVSVGFFMPPVATYCMRLHEGFSLANAGFASGLVATMMVSIFRAFGVEFELRDVWGTGDTTVLAIFLYTVSVVFLLAGYLEEKHPYRTIMDLWEEPGKLVTDFTLLFGFKNAYYNMGILGIAYTSIILILGGSINGLIIAGIFTTVGFGAFGMHPFNTIPVSFGAFLGSVLNIWPPTSPQMLLSILFSTTLAPITGTFGVFWGIIAGFLHTCISMNISDISGGISLYSNGFAGGIVVIVLLPIITSLREGKSK